MAQRIELAQTLAQSNDVNNQRIGKALLNHMQDMKNMGGYDDNYVYSPQAMDFLTNTIAGLLGNTKAMKEAADIETKQVKVVKERNEAASEATNNYNEDKRNISETLGTNEYFYGSNLRNAYLGSMKIVEEATGRAFKKDFGDSPAYIDPQTILKMFNDNWEDGPDFWMKREKTYDIKNIKPEYASMFLNQVMNGTALRLKKGKNLSAEDRLNLAKSIGESMGYTYKNKRWVRAISDSDEESLEDIVNRSDLNWD